MTYREKQFGSLHAKDEDDVDAFDAAHGVIGEAKLDLFTEGDLDQMRLDADDADELRGEIQTRLHHYAQQAAATDAGHYGPDQIHSEAMDMLNEMVQRWADDNDLPLDFA